MILGRIEPSTVCTVALPVSVWKYKWTAWFPPIRSATSGIFSVRETRAQTLHSRLQWEATLSPASTFAPPNALAMNLLRSPPSFINSLMRSSIAWIPHRGFLFAHGAIWQQDMIHAASAKHRVVHAYSNARTKQRVENDGRLDSPQCHRCEGLSDCRLAGGPSLLFGFATSLLDSDRF